MEESEINDYPPANIIYNETEGIDYPILRCEDCHEILSIDLKINKNQIQCKCEKEGKIRNIDFKQFFESITKYKNFNCCQFCKEENKTQKYYLCKTCSNKIMCEDCFRKHNKDDDTIKFKIDSTCKKHFNPYESYCPKCGENKCSYCSIDHDEKHEKEEFLLKTKLIKKNKLDNFKNTIKKIKSEKTKIELVINSIIKELVEKIENLNKLKKNFFDCLNTKIKYVELVLNNYEKKLNDFDINYFIINNLKNQLNFNLKEINLNKNDKLDEKIKNVTSYLEENINSQFNFKIEEENIINNEEEEKKIDDEAIDCDYKFIKNFNFDIIGLMDFNENLFCFYSSNSINFYSKKDYKNKFNIKEYELNGILICKKINDEKILAYTNKNIVIIDIIDNNDYAISKRINFYKQIFDFNSTLDLLCLDYNKNENNYNYNYYNNNIERFIIKLICFPDYNRDKFSIPINKQNYDLNDKLQFINNYIFFHISYDYLEVYKIVFGDCYLQNKSSLRIDYKNASIIELSNDFYCLNDLKIIYLLSKNDLSLTKTINIATNNLGLLKLSDNSVTIFVNESGKLVSKNYDILSNGIKWTLNQAQSLLNKEVISCCNDKKYLLFKNKNSNYNYNAQWECSLFEMNNYNDKNLENSSNNKNQCILI